MCRMKDTRRTSFAPAVLVALAGALTVALAVALAGRPARAADETDAMHFRARSGLQATKRDREHARWLLEEWRESERASSEPGDRALGRALAGIAEGRRLAQAEFAALDRYATTRRADRIAAEGEVPGAASGAERGAGLAASARGRRRRIGWMLAVAGAGAGVLAAGVIWIVAARRLGKG